MNHWEPPCVILPKKKPHPACPVDAHRTGRVALPDGQPIQGAVPRCRCLPLCQRREKSWADENQSLSSTRYWGGIPVSIDVTSTLNAAVFCIFTASPVCCYVNGHVSSRLRVFRTLLGGSFSDLMAPVRIPLVLCRAKIKSLYLRFAVFGGNLYGLFVCGQPQPSRQVLGGLTVLHGAENTNPPVRQCLGYGSPHTSVSPCSSG
ncbi:hypothetical protein V8F06_003553 [Rhypophila decipiens]